jgi:hypothetical protein
MLERVRSDLDHIVPSVVISWLQDIVPSQEGFLDDIPNELPLLRGMEHQIDFIHRASISNRPAYRSNPEEMKGSYLCESMSKVDANLVITWSRNPYAKTSIPEKPSKSGLIGV